jgi:hypothetical protein
MAVGVPAGKVRSLVYPVCEACVEFNVKHPTAADARVVAAVRRQNGAGPQN